MNIGVAQVFNGEKPRDLTPQEPYNDSDLPLQSIIKVDNSIKRNIFEQRTEIELF